MGIVSSCVRGKVGGKATERCVKNACGLWSCVNEKAIGVKPPTNGGEQRLGQRGAKRCFPAAAATRTEDFNVQRLMNILNSDLKAI